VKGHAGIKENERCDVLATTAAQSKPTDVDVNYERYEAEEKNTDQSTGSSRLDF
jgi:ribonuclease HI